MQRVVQPHHRWAPVVLVLAGCVETTPLPFELDAEDGDLVVVAVTTSDGALRSADVYLQGTPAPSSPVGPDDQIHAFLVRRTDLVDELGAPLPDERFEGLTVARGDPDCVDDALAAPKIVFDGETCPVPAFAEVRSTGGEAPALVLAWPGEKSCASRQPTSPPAPSFDLEHPDPSFWPHARVAATSSGAIALFGEHDAVVADAAGVGAHLRGSTPFVDAILGATATNDGTFIVSSVDRQEPNVAAVFTIFDSSLNVVSGPRGIEHTGVAFEVVDDDRIIVAGEGILANPGAMLCNAALDDCEKMVPDGLDPVLGRTLVDILRMPDGALLFVGWNGLVVFERTPRREELGAFRLDSADEDPMNGRKWWRGALVAGGSTTGVGLHAFNKQFGDGLVEKEYTLRSAALLAGDQVLFCADGPGETVVLRTAIGVRHASIEPDEMRVVARLPGGGCSGFAGDPSGVRLTSKSGAFVVVDAAGAVASRGDAGVLDGVADVPTYVETLAVGRTVAATIDGTTYVRDDPATTFTRWYGSTEPIGGAPVGFFEREESTVALSQRGVLTEFRAGLVTAQTLPLEPRALVTAAHSDDGVIHAFGVDDAGAWVRAIEGSAWSGPERRLDPIAAVRGHARVRPNTAVLLADDGRLYVDDGQTLTVVEGERSVCLTDVVADRGVVWAVGCDTTVLRVNAYASPPTAWRVEVADRSALLRGAVLDCPDELLALDGAASGGPYLLRLVDGAFEDTERFEPEVPKRIGALGAAQALVRDDRATLLLQQFGVRPAGGVSLFRIEDVPWRGGTLPDGRFVFGTVSGRYFVESGIE